MIPKLSSSLTSGSEISGLVLQIYSNLNCICPIKFKDQILIFDAPFLLAVISLKHLQTGESFPCFINSIRQCPNQFKSVSVNSFMQSPPCLSIRFHYATIFIAHSQLHPWIPITDQVSSLSSTTLSSQRSISAHCSTQLGSFRLGASTIECTW